jgi:hypothetical protein
MESDLPLVGLSGEYSAVCSVLRDKRPLLLLGPPGSGKSKVVMSALRNLHSPAVYLRTLPVLHELLFELSLALIKNSHGLAHRIDVPDQALWLSRQTSVRLKGLLWNALAAEPASIVLDHIEEGSNKTYRFLQRIYHTPGAAIIAVARRRRDLGALGRLFWDPREAITFMPLSQRDARILFEQAVRLYKLECLNFEDLREQIIQAAHGRPGKIVEMCRLAADSRYRKDGRVLFSTVQLDTIGSFLD